MMGRYVSPRVSLLSGTSPQLSLQSGVGIGVGVGVVGDGADDIGDFDG